MEFYTVEKQRTLASSARLAGTALHTGEKVTLTLHPAPVGHGFKFKRSDLPDDPIIEARVENVRTVERARSLGTPKRSATSPTVAASRSAMCRSSASSFAPSVFGAKRSLLAYNCSQTIFGYICNQEKFVRANTRSANRRQGAQEQAKGLLNSRLARG